jgi:hypothetical protein
MSTSKIIICGTTILIFSKNDPVMTRVSGATPFVTVEEKLDINIQKN